MRINVGEMNAAILEYERHFPDDLMYSSHPGNGQHRYVFQRRVIVGCAAAYWYMVGRVEGIKAAREESERRERADRNLCCDEWGMTINR